MTERETTTEIGPLEEPHRRAEMRQERRRRLTELGHRWDPTIRGELRRLAERFWPGGHVLGVLPLHHCRLRHRVEEDAWLWWIERAIPPYDLCRCETYRVTLALNASNEPALPVRDGVGVHRVAGRGVSDLQAALAKASANTLLVISRAMGEASD